MSFQTEVEGLTSLSVGTTPTTTELSTFLKDGVIDVTNRWLLVRPQDIELFARESDEQTSNTTSPLDLNGAKIISVIRENGTDSQWRPCRKISPALQYDVTDVESLNYASKINPAYMVGNDGRISVFPAPGAGTDAFKVYYVNNDPVDKTATPVALDQDDTAIGFFPDDKVYLVIIYASMRSLQANMGATTISDFSALADLSVSAVTPASPTITVSTVSFSQAAPTYTKPTISLVPAPAISDLTIVASAPGSPSDPVISYSNASVGDAVSVAQDSIAAAVDSIAGAVDAITEGPSNATGTTDVQAPTDAAGITDSEAPQNASGAGDSAYTKPSVQGTANEITDVSAGTFGSPDVGPDTWWDTLSDIIEIEEDSELAQVQIGKIQAYIQAFQAEVQSASALMQSTISDAQLATQASIANASNDVATNNASIASLTQASIANAANDVSTNNASMQTLLQASVANAQNDVNASIAKMQNSTNAATAKMQQSTSAATQKMAQSTTAAVQKMQLSTNVNVQNAAKTLEASIQTYAQEITLFQGEVAKYQAEIAAEVQAYQQNLAGDLQVWQAERTTDLQKYATDLQNELNEFNKENAAYQVQLQVSLQNAQLEDAEEAKKIQKYAAELQVYQAEVATEVQRYQAEVATEVQAYTQNLQADGVGYQWLQDQYAMLKAEYDQAFMLAAPQQQATPEVARG